MPPPGTINVDADTRHGARKAAEREGKHVAHVFIVDDDPGIREVLRSALEAEGYIVIEAADGVSALERLRASPCPLIVLLDLSMPRLDGAGVLEAVTREQALAQRHRFVLVTANPLPLPPALYTLLASLEVPLLAKPFDVDILLDMVAHLANDAHRARRARAASPAAHPSVGGRAAGEAGAAAPARLPPKRRLMKKGRRRAEAGQQAIRHVSRARARGPTAPPLLMADA
jgi:CheY-like chemotaxis protein